MFEITFLGTAASVPTATRSVSALLVFHESHRFLVDCGEGTQRQLIRSGAGFRRLDSVLLTHGHLDHVLGLGGLVATLSEWEPMDHLTIYGGTNALSAARDLLEGVVLPRAGSLLALDFAALSPGPVIEDARFRLSAVALRHAREDAYGFIFEDKPQRHFDEDAAHRLGIPEGRARHRLAHGEAVTLDDGRRVAPEDVMGEAKPGTKLVVLGDLDSTEGLVEPLRGADALVLEATYLDADRALADSHGHITAGDAARLATAAGVHALYLNHISGRYDEADILTEARAIFPGAKIAHDLDRVSVIRKRPDGGLRKIR
jgi:ribonuclease Z